MQEKQRCFMECVQGPDIYLSIYTALYLVRLIILHYTDPCLLSCFPAKDYSVPKLNLKSGRRVELVVVVSLHVFYFCHLRLLFRGITFFLVLLTIKSLYSETFKDAFI